MEQQASSEPSRSGAPSLVFVGGTGRSGTHVVARILGRHRDLENVANEVRFHVDPGGFPDLLAGRTTPERFVRRLRGRWWRGLALHRLSTRGLHRYVERADLDAACARFLDRYRDDPEEACRRLFWELLGPVAEAAGKPGLVEQSCDTVAQAPTLLRLFPEARFVHVIRDGRDAAASRVAQGRRLARPRTVEQGLRWWERRIRRIDAARRALPEDRCITVSLDGLIESHRFLNLNQLRRFLGLERDPEMRRFFKRRVSGSRGNVERWRRRLSRRRQQRIDALYREILAGLERDGVEGTWMLVSTYERRRNGGPAA